jgi:hypothetical protein
MYGLQGCTLTNNFEHKYTLMRTRIYMLALSIACFAGCAKIPNNPEIEPRDPQTPGFYEFFQPRTLKAGDHIIDGHYTVNSTLTLEAGAQLLFTKRGSLTVGRYGKIIANGSAAAPIVFRSSTNTKGTWRGLLIEQGSTGSVFDYCVIKHAGIMRDNTNGTTDQGRAMVYLSGQASFTNCVFEEGPGTTFTFNSYYNSNPTQVKQGTLGTWSNNIIRNMDSLALVIPASELKNLDANSSFTNNKYNFILFSSLTPSDSADLVFYKNEAIYINNFNPSAGQAGSSLQVYKSITANPGARVQVQALWAAIKMNLVGTAADPVQVLGIPGIIGQASPCKVYLNSNEGTIVNHASFKDIRLTCTTGRSQGYYNLQNANSDISIQNIAVENQYGDGIQLFDAGLNSTTAVLYTMSKFENIKVTNCAGYPLIMPLSTPLTGTSSFSNNQKQRILVAGGASVSNAVIKNYGVPYEIGNSSAVNPYGEVLLTGSSTIEAGVKIFINSISSTALRINDGTLSAAGTSAQPIEFYGTSIDQLSPLQLTQLGGVLSYCTFNHFGFGGSGTGNTLSLFNCTLQLQNCSFGNTTGCGVKSFNSPNWDAGGNTITGGTVLACP